MLIGIGGLSDHLIPGASRFFYGPVIQGESGRIECSTFFRAVWSPLFFRQPTRCLQC